MALIVGARAGTPGSAPETMAKTLAEHLGVADPAKPEDQGRDFPDLTSSMSDAEIAKGILLSKQYRESILNRIIMGELPPAVECMLWDRAYGKVTTKIEVKDTTDPVEDFNAAQCEEYAMKLMEQARKLRTQKQEPDVAQTIRQSIH